MSDAHGGGGGGIDAKFFVGIVIGLALVWLFGLYRTGQLFEPTDSQAPESSTETVSSATEDVPTVMDTERYTTAATYEYAPEYEYREQPPLPPHHPPLAEHGITYYLDANGDVIDVYRY